MSDLVPIDRDFMLRWIQEELPEPVRTERQPDGSLILIGGDPKEIIVKINGGKISIFEFAARWDGPHDLVVHPKPLATLNWRRLPASRTMMTLHFLIESACEMRRAKYRKCERCGEMNPPEWMHGKDICHSCAEKHLGIVY